MLAIAIGVLLIALGAMRLLMLLGDAFIASVDADPRLPGWALRPALLSLAMIVAGILILISGGFP